MTTGNVRSLGRAAALKLKGKDWVWALAALVVFLVLPAIVPTARTQYLLSTTFIFALAAFGLFIIYAYEGQLFLCQAALMGVGAYTATILALRYGFSFWLGMVPAVLLTAAIGTCIAALMVRSRGHYFIIGSFVIGEFIVLLIRRLDWLTKGSYGLAIGRNPEGFGLIDFASSAAWYYLSFAFLLAGMAGVLWLSRSRMFWKFNAIREDETLARALGIHPMREKLVGTAISSLYAGVAGVLFAFHQGFIDPTLFEGFNNVKIVFIVIMGAILIGSHHKLGPVLGALIVIFLPQMLGLPALWNNIVYGLLLIVVVLASVTGLFRSGTRLSRSPANNKVEPTSGGDSRSPVTN